MTRYDTSWAPYGTSSVLCLIVHPGVLFDVCGRCCTRQTIRYTRRVPRLSRKRNREDSATSDLQHPSSQPLTRQTDTCCRMKSFSGQFLAPCSPHTQRLPVNPRRQKVAPEQRKRAIRACNACNLRRVKCSGDQPCHRCSKVSRDCEYAAPAISRNALLDENRRLRRLCAELGKGDLVAAQDEERDTVGRLERYESAGESSDQTFSPTATLGSIHPSPGRLLCDLDGTTRFLGETSGATFLDQLKGLMLKLVPLKFEPGSKDGSSFVATIGGYQTFDSRPLPNPDVDPLWLPSRREMVSMLGDLRDIIQDGKDDLLSGGIYYWGDMSTPPVPASISASLSTLTTDDSHRHLAFYHVCFALVSSTFSLTVRYSEQHNGEAYFKRARTLLGNPLDTVRFTLSDVPVLMLMGFYLIEINRRDAAYMHVSLAVHIALMHGAFRTRVDEAKKRTFWTLYILDRWLGVLMGRPSTLADEAIKLPLPCDVTSMPPSAGIRAHIDLARISGKIVCETFRIAPRRHRRGSSAHGIQEALQMLECWRINLPPELSLASTEPSCQTLHMTYNQLIVLTTRPILLAAVKQAVHGMGWNVQHHAHATHISACSEAANRNLVLARQLRKKRKLLQASLHFVFNATVILLLNRIAVGASGLFIGTQEGSNTMLLPDKQMYDIEIESAIDIFREEAKTGTHYPKDCCQVLEDIKALVDHYLYQSEDPAHRREIVGYAPDPSVQIDLPGHVPELGHDTMPWAETNWLNQSLVGWEPSEDLQLQESMLL